MQFTKRISLLFLSSITLILVVILGDPQVTNSAPLDNKEPDLLYIADKDDLPISFDAFESAGVYITPEIRSDDQLESLNVLYIHPEMLSDLAPELLKSLYANRVIIVAIGTSLSSLSEVLDEDFEGDDLPQKIIDSNEEMTQVVFVQSNVTPTQDGSWGYYDLFPNKQLDLIFDVVVNRQVEESRIKSADDSLKSGVSCTPSPTIDIKAGNWTTAINSTLQGVHWSTTGQSTSGSTYVTNASSMHSSGNTNSHYLRAKTEIWTNCETVHRISWNSLGSYNSGAVCNVSTSVLSNTGGWCSTSAYWGKSVHSIKPTVTSGWTVGYTPNLTIAP